MEEDRYVDEEQIQFVTQGEGEIKKGTGIQGACEMAPESRAPTYQTRAWVSRAPMKQQLANYERPIYEYKDK